MSLDTVLILCGVLCVVIGASWLSFEAGKTYGHEEARRGYERMWRIRERQEQNR